MEEAIPAAPPLPNEHYDMPGRGVRNISLGNTKSNVQSPMSKVDVRREPDFGPWTLDFGLITINDSWPNQANFKRLSNMHLLGQFCRVSESCRAAQQ